MMEYLYLTFFIILDFLIFFLVTKVNSKQKFLLILLTHIFFIVFATLHIKVFKLAIKFPDLLFIVLGFFSFSLIYINLCLRLIEFLPFIIFKLSENIKFVLFLIILTFVILIQSMLIFSPEIHYDFIP